MAPSVTKDRYPKRKRASINYEIDQSIDGDLDLEEDGYFSEELGEDSTASGSSNAPASAASAQQASTTTVVEVDSEYEDATFGSRKIKKRKVTSKAKARSQPKPKPPPKFMPFRLMDLPPELRLKVYEEALVDPFGVTIRTYMDKWESFPVHVNLGNMGPYLVTDRRCYVRGKWTSIPAAEVPKKKYQLSPNLLAVSKTIHNEAVSLLWKQPFMFTDVQGLHAFLLRLRPDTIARLRDITLLQGAWSNQKCLPAFVLLRDARFLQNLRLDCRVRPDIRLRSGLSKEVSMGQQLATKLYSNCHPFLKSIIKQQGTDSILRVLKFAREEFKNNYYDHMTGGWVRDDWSQGREDTILEAMVAELKVIMTRKVVPRFPRSRY